MTKRITKPSFRKQLKAMYGTKCKLCGAEGVEYHHFLPLWQGGTDDIRNFVPLCGECHAKSHGLRTGAWKRRNGGRKRINPVGFKYIMDDYFHCRIGTEECKKSMGLAKGTHITDRKNVQEYMKENGIKAFRNNIDILRAKKERVGRADKQTVGWIEYTDGRREEFDRSSLRTPI